ncbi:MAG: potassium channel protein [FCB group bacterium]|nr:potassium channel protein [FCB group bacterium]
MIGTLGFYTLLDHLTISESLYLTVTTLTTVGYGDITPLTSMPADGNPSVVLGFTIFLILFGMGAFLYTLGIVTEYVVSSELGGRGRRRKMLKAIANLRGHYIVCGAGRTGAVIINELMSTGRPFVVIENSSERIKALKKLYKNILCLNGDATEESVLETAGLNYAEGIALALQEEKDNLYIVLEMAEICQRNPNFRIVAKVNNLQGTGPKLKSAGADVVISPHEISGKRMLAEMMRPSVTTFLGQMLEESNLVYRFDQAKVGIQSPLVGMSFDRVRQKAGQGLTILAIRRKGQQEFIMRPADEHVLAEGDVLICLGDAENISKLRLQCSRNES